MFLKLCELLMFHPYFTDFLSIDVFHGSRSTSVQISNQSEKTVKIPAKQFFRNPINH